MIFVFSALVLMVFISLFFLGSTQFPFLPDWSHGLEGGYIWDKVPGDGARVYFAGGDDVGCLAHTIFSSYRPHRAAAAPVRVPVVKLFLTYVHAGINY